MNAFDNTARVVINAPLGVTVAAIACLAILVCLWATHRNIRPFTAIWMAVFAFFAAFFGVWCAMGLCDVDAFTFVFCETVIGAVGVFIPLREQVADKLAGQRIGVPDGRKGSRRRIFARGIPAIAGRDAALLLVAAFFALATVESADNANWIWLRTDCFFAALVLTLVAMCALYFLGQRRGVLAVLVTAACIALGATEYFVDLLRDTAFQPSDILAWQTAAAVSGGYAFTIGDTLMQAAICGVASLAALAFIAPPSADAAGASTPETAGDGAAVAGQVESPSATDGAHAARGKGRKGTGRRPLKQLVANLVCAAVLGGGLLGFVTFVDFHDAFNVSLLYWDLRSSYRSETFTLCFTTAAQDLRIQEPAGYTQQGAQELESQLAAAYDADQPEGRSEAEAQFQQQKPNVIAIMNESYADLSIYQQLHSGYLGTYVTRELTGATLSGMLHVSVFGAGTCNTEYEFLSGDSMAFLGQGMYPFQQFDLDRFDALPKQFGAMGYHTVGIHPSYADNWRRNVVYPQMGFDESYFFGDFDDPAAFHRTVRDSASYDMALDKLKESDEPTFVFDVTIQNHGGYDTHSIAAEDLVEVDPDFGTEEDTAKLEEYLSCIKASDEDIEALLEELEDFDEPTVVVFFGDHQPSIARGINDELYPLEDDLAHTTRMMQTPFFIWANYDIEGTVAETGVDTSANYLAAQLLEAIGAPLSDYQKAQLALRRTLPAVDVSGYEDSSDTWHASTDDPQVADDVVQAYEDLEAISYLEVESKL